MIQSRLLREQTIICEGDVIVVLVVVCIFAYNIYMFGSPTLVTNWTGFPFKGRLDLNKVAIVGHSFGGATTVMSLAKDKRFR